LGAAGVPVGVKGSRKDRLRLEGFKIKIRRRSSKIKIKIKIKIRGVGREFYRGLRLSGVNQEVELGRLTFLNLES